MIRCKYFRLVAALSILLISPAPSWATDTLDEIVVYADFRERIAADLPASITVFDSEEIERMAVQHFEELISAVPNLNWSGDGHRARYFQMRGVGELEQYQGAPNPSVGFLIDDIDFSGIGTVATLFDMQHIEVLRGPQGTRYGANALAGLIYMRSAAPTAEFDGKAELSAGDDGMFAGGIALGGSLNADDSVRGRVSVHRHQSNGFHNNTYLHRDDTNGRDETTIRGRLHWSPADSWTFNLAGVYADINNGYDGFALDNSLRTLSDKPGKDAQQSVGASLRAEYSGFERATLTSITSFADSDIVFSYDADWGNDDSWAPVLYDYVSINNRSRSTLSQEFRLVAGNVLVGLYALKLGDEIATFNGGEYYDPFYDWADSLNDLFVSDYEATNMAVFGQLDQSVGDATQLTVGLRIERRSTDYDDTSGLQAAPAESMWGGDITLSHDHSDSLTSFFVFSRGYKSGGFNLGAAVPDGYRKFIGEELWNLEAGVKAFWRERSLRVNASVFANRRKDQQVRTSFQLSPGDPTSFGFVTINVEEGETVGIEADIRWLPDDNWMLYATVGVLAANFGEVKAPSLANLIDREQAHAPDYTFAFGGSYDHP
ncbi:MAG: TonB-dependent receptor, partial [Gammaproteobacteria bacterium]|nr:TonB-dependent receptor [Gammaproteobacteria bacterium]